MREIAATILVGLLGAIALTVAFVVPLMLLRSIVRYHRAASERASNASLKGTTDARTPPPQSTRGTASLHWERRIPRATVDRWN